MSRDELILQNYEHLLNHFRELATQCRKEGRFDAANLAEEPLHQLKNFQPPFIEESIRFYPPPRRSGPRSNLPPNKPRLPQSERNPSQKVPKRTETYN